MSAKKKKRNSDSGCIASAVRVFFGIAVIAAITYIIADDLSDQAKLDLTIAAGVAAAAVVLHIICRIWFRLRRRYSLKKLDEMDGHEFEYACADILRANGFKNVSVTKSTGDFGVDIIADKRRERYAIQCKCYSKTLGNKPIQEVIGGLAYYDCTVGAVMTNQYFTDRARQLAEVNGVKLWDRDVLAKMLRRAKKGRDYTDTDLTDTADEYNDDYSDGQEYAADDDDGGA